MAISRTATEEVRQPESAYALTQLLPSSYFFCTAVYSSKLEIDIVALSLGQNRDATRTKNVPVVARICV